MSPHELRRFRAERLLRKDFAGLRSRVLAVVRSQLRSKGIVLDASDLEACYAQAWHGLYTTVLNGELVENPSAWLVLVTFRRAIDESRSAGRIGVVEGEEMGSFPWGSDASADDLVGELDNRARLRRIFEGMRASLSERECQAASLCYLQGLSRADAAEHMGISEARMRKLMEGSGRGQRGVTGKMGELLDTIKAGGWCEQQSSLMRAFAFGILDPEGERHALALAHCRECPACRAHVASLRGLASVLPLPLLSPPALGGADGTSTKVAGSGGPDTTRTAGRAGSTGACTAPATRLAATGLRFGLPGGGWSGLAGSLTAKLAVTAVVLIGAGYALLGSRAHGSAGGRSGHAASAPPPFASEAFAQAILPTFAAHIHPAGTTSRSAPSHARSPRIARTTHSAGQAGSGEFSPERLHRERVVVSPVATPTLKRSSRGSSRTAREFGIE